MSQITTKTYIMTILEKYNNENLLLNTYKKDGLTLEVRKDCYFILLSNGAVTKKGKRLSKELKTYFNI